MWPYWSPIGALFSHCGALFSHFGAIGCPVATCEPHVGLMLALHAPSELRWTSDTTQTHPSGLIANYRQLSDPFLIKHPMIYWIFRDPLLDPYCVPIVSPDVLN